MIEEISNRPGWAVIVEEAKEVLERVCSTEQHRCRLNAASVQQGRLHLEIVNSNEASRGLFEAARAVSAEVCELCGGRGNPVGDGHRLLGCRCEACRATGTERLERDWRGRSHKHDSSAASGESSGERVPGIVTNDGGSTVHARAPACSETRYQDRLALLMSATDDERAMDGWTSNPGWAGLVRALFVTLQAEQGTPVADAGPVLPRLPYMKEKYGQLRIEFGYVSEYLWGVDWFIEDLSGKICMHCGMPGECRDRAWVRTECDACAAITDKKVRSRF